MEKPGEERQAKDLAMARQQVKAWEEMYLWNKEELEEIKVKLDLAFERGKTIAANLTDAKEYLQILERDLSD